MSKENIGYLVSESITLGSNTKVIKEKESSVVFQAQLQEANVPNRNGRIYPKEVIQTALDAPNVREKIEHKAFYGRICPSL